MVCSLAGECTASLCLPWWVCQLMCGEPAQLHFTSVTAVAQTQWGGWCAHSKGSARRPWAAHDGYVRWCVVNQHSCTLHWWWQWPRLRFFWGVGDGGTTNNDTWMQDLFTDPVVPNDCAIWQTLHAFSRMCWQCEVATVGELQCQCCF